MHTLKNEVNLAANAFLFKIFHKRYFRCVTFGGITVLMSLLLHQTHSEEDDVLTEEEDEVEEDGAGTTMELPVLELESGNQEFEQALVIRQEEFAELERGNDNTEEELKDKKVGENILHMYVIEIFSFLVLCFSATKLYSCVLILCVD